MAKNVDALLEEYRKLKSERKIDFFKPYDWQLEFLNSTGEDHGAYSQIALICANRIGKTVSGVVGLSMHLSGDYKPWYEGKKFKKPIRACCLGISGDQIRDVLQRELIGMCDLGSKIFHGDGYIPLDLLDKKNFIPSTGVKGLLKEIKVKHVSGGWSTLIFRSSEQGRAVLQGQSLDVTLQDEESKYNGLEVYGEALSRTATAQGGKGGISMLTFTPENGMTPLVDMLLNHDIEGQYVRQVGWDKAPHLDEKTKKQLLSAIPEYMRPAKTEGRVTYGSAIVFGVKEEDVMCDPFPIPDYFPRVCGIDFGIDHYFGACFSAYDRDRDIIYIYDVIKVRGEVATQHSHLIRQKGGQIRVIYPHDGHTRSKGDGKKLVDFYKDAGLNCFRMFSNGDNTQTIEVGIYELLVRMKEGRLKVFNNLGQFWEEFRKYRRNDNGKIIAKDDDLMSSFRYSACSVVRFGAGEDQNENIITNYVPHLDY